MKETINILHLSDLHFGAEPTSNVTSTAIAMRLNTLNPLLKTLGELDSEWKPDIVVVSGDIGWRGAQKDYTEAKVWLSKLLSTLHLTPNELVVCAGNHDIDRAMAVGVLPPKSAKMADDWLNIETLDNFIRPFVNFNSFCKEMGIPDLKLGETTSYLTGMREIDELRFVVFNSSWFCRGDGDKDHLWIGLPLLKLMNSANQLVSVDNYDDEPLTIAVIHHTPEWFAGEEIHKYDRPGTYYYFSDRSHMILSGHVHGRIIAPEKKHNRAHLFIGGAGYQGNDYRNNFGIFKVNKLDRSVTRRSFEFDPANEKWIEHYEKDEVLLRIKSPIPKTEVTHKNKDAFDVDYLSLSQKATEHAERYVSQKSKTITNVGTLPKLINRKVSVHNREERIAVSNDERLVLNTLNNFAPLSEVIYTGRPTFLFGELGSGKSTLVGQYCVELFEQSHENIALLIPAKFFLNKKIDTIASLSSHVSNYVNEHIYPERNSDFELFSVLSNKIEITLIIDGFDELDRSNSQQLVIRLEELVQHWPHIRVIATGRPIEMQGINYSSWQCLELTSLSNAEQELLLFNEASAAGMDEETAKNDATERYNLLKENPELFTIATSPLVIRLLRPYLTHYQKRRSLGDLLYDVILERLGNWSEREGKDENVKEFKKKFPDSYSREVILGKIAASIFNTANGSITKEALYTLIKCEVHNTEDTHLIVSQACEFFSKNVLQKEGDAFVFPSQPLYQCALGIFIANEFSQNQKPALKTDLSLLWREFSFAASIVKRRNILDNLRVHFQEYIENLLDNDWARAPVAIIIAESGDHQLATSYINYLQECEFRPVNYYSGFKALSSSSYAYCIYLAKDEGFDWFYENYLDPKYPYSHVLDDVADSILQNWLLYSNFNINPKQSDKLSNIIEPSITTQSWQCHSLLPTISMALPSYFKNDILAILYAKKLSSNLFRDKAISMLKELYHRNKEDVLDALQKNRSSIAAQLWLELCEEQPPSSIIHSIVEAWPNNKKLFENLKIRVDERKLSSILRWYVLQKDKVATFSALILYDLGERNLNLLGKGLLQGLHDGGKIQGAEEILHEMIKDYGENGLEWLVNLFPDVDSIDGAHSAYWRILLQELNESETPFTNYLYFATRYLGEFILPRYPDIRRNLTKLLTEKPEYREELYNKGLRSLDNKIRYNTACILLTCFPETECESAEIVIRSTLHGFQRSEWNRFCMRLALGKEVLQHIHSKLETFLPVPKTFSIKLLYHNNFKISEDDYRFMVVGLLNPNASSFDHTGIRDDEDNVKKVLVQAEVVNILIQQIESNNKELAREAANALWHYHSTKLDEEQLITCWVLLNTKMDFWTLQNMEESSVSFKNNAKLIESVVHKIQKEFNHETIVGQYIRTFSDTMAWKDILWSSMFTTRGLDQHQIERTFLWLLNKGNKNKDIADVIGPAASEFLEHPSITADTMYNVAAPWLAFLAHEFGGLSDARLEHSIISYVPIGEEIVCTLIARLGYVPQNYRKRKDRQYLLPSPEKEINESYSFEKVIEITRDSEEMHNNFASCIENSIISESVNEKELEQIAVKTRFGGIFSSIILFCQGKLNNYEPIVHSIGLELARTNQNKSADIVVNSIQIIRSVIATDSLYSKEYFKSIEKIIEANNHENIILLYEELLEYQQNLRSSLLPTALSELVSSPYRLDMNLAIWFSDFFANKIKEDQKSFVINELKKVVLSLNSRDERFSSRRFGLAEWLFSLAVIYLDEDVDSETERLFLTGLISIFIEDEVRQNHSFDNKKYFKLRDILNSVYPLFQKVPFERLRGIIQRGSTSEVPEISTCCRILLALAGQNN